MNAGDRRCAHRVASFALSKYAVLLEERELRQVRSVRRSDPLRLLDAPDEAAHRGPERELRVDVQVPREIDRREEDVSDLLEHPRVGLGLRELGPPPGRRRRGARAISSPRSSPRAIGARVVESDRRRTPSRLACVRERRQPLGERRGSPFTTLLLGLDLLPALADTAGGLRLGVAEDVRVPPHELLVGAPGDLLEISLASLLQEQRQEVDLEEQVSELVAKRRRRRPTARRRRPRRPLRSCAGRSCPRSARGPRGSPGEAAVSAPGGRGAPPRGT